MIKPASIPARQIGRRRISVNLSEPRTLKLYQVGRRLLATADFEDISIARFAKEGGTSVGAFYVRFADKDAFLDFITSHTFGSARRGFAHALPSIVSHAKPLGALADAMIGQMSGNESAGIVRLSVKRGFTDLRNRRPFDAYREYVSDEVIGALSDAAKSEQNAALELAIAASFGILTDAITSTSPQEPLGLSDYRDTIISLLANPLENTELEKREPIEEPEQSSVKKI